MSCDGETVGRRVINFVDGSVWFITPLFNFFNEQDIIVLMCTRGQSAMSSHSLHMGQIDTPL